jgi:hypothetical protein
MVPCSLLSVLCNLCTNAMCVCRRFSNFKIIEDGEVRKYKVQGTRKNTSSLQQRAGIAS